MYIFMLELKYVLVKTFIFMIEKVHCVPEKYN